MGGYHVATLTLASAMIVGVVCSILAERLKISSLVLYLLAGVLLGPSGIGFLHPEALGAGLEGLVSLGIAIILFEGAVELDFSQLRETRVIVRNLITVGMIITTVLATAAVILLTDLPWEIALLYGAIMTVTGPTVIRPIIRRVPLVKPLGAILHWESVLIDPLGAILAVFVFELVVAGGTSIASTIFTLSQALLIGGLIGGVVGMLYAESLRRRIWSQPEQRNIGAIAVALLMYTMSEHLIPHSGLVAVVIGGLAVGWRASREREEILRFKGTLVTLILSTLFVLLSSNLIIENIFALGKTGVYVVVVLLFVVRPVNVLVSTYGSDLNFRQKAFLSLVAPRGIIAASIASLFTFQLQNNGMPSAAQLESLCYLTIGITVLIQGLPAGLIARILGVRGKPRRGFLIVGSHELSRRIALWMNGHGIEARLIDTDLSEVMEARQAGLVAYYGNAIDEHDVERIDMQDIGNLLALTSNDEVNILTCQLGSRLFGQENIWRVTEERQILTKTGVIESRGGQRVFPGIPSIDTVIELLRSKNATLETRTAEEQFKVATLEYQSEIPLFYKNGDDLLPVSPDKNIPKGSDVLWLIEKQTL